MEALFESEDLQGLESKGLVSASQARKRVLSASTIYSTSSEEAASTQVVGAQSFTIPESFDTVEYLEYLGLDSAAAASVMSLWCRDFAAGCPEEGPIDLVDLAKGHVGHNGLDAWDDDHDWPACVRSLPITSELATALLKTEFTDILHTKSAREWVWDTIELRYRTLLDIQDASRARQRASQERSRRRRASGSFSRPEIDVAQQRELTPGIISPPESTLMSLEARRAGTILNSSRALTLWKGCDLRRTDGLIDMTGQVDIGVLESSVPSDFRGRGDNLVYLTLDKEIAIRYRDWVKNRAECTRAVLVRVTLSNELVQSLEPKILRFGHEWKELVWHCRRRDRIPRHLQHLTDERLVIGHICGKATKMVATLGSYHDLRERHVFRLSDGRMATQHVFQGEEVQDELNSKAEFAIMESG